jgi:hypothetical protein
MSIQPDGIDTWQMQGMPMVSEPYVRCPDCDNKVYINLNKTCMTCDPQDADMVIE